MSELLDDLPFAHLEYALRDGAVGDWLVLGPLLAPLTESVNLQSKVARQLALNSMIVDADEIVLPPAERATNEVTVAEGIRVAGMWRVVNTLDDGWVDLAATVTTPHIVCAWAYSQVVLPQRTTVKVVLTIASPVQVWINGEGVFADDELPDQPSVRHFDATFDEGSNEILVRVTNVGMGDVPMLLALELPETTGLVTLPTVLEPVTRRQKLQTVMEHAYLAQAVYSREQRIILRWPTDMHMIDALTARLQTPSGRIYGEGNPMVQRGAKVDFGEAAQFPDGLFEILLQPQFEEYYVQDMRVQRRIPFEIRNGKWSILYYGSHAERRQEALEDAAKRGGISAEIAKSALGQWNALRHELLEQTLEEISQRAVGYEHLLLAMLGWVARMGDLPDFPQEATWELEERAPMVLEYGGNYPDVVAATCDLLAGQLYGDRTFADLNTGEWHQSQAEAWLLTWLRATAQLGLPSGDGQRSYADALLALSHLTDLARADEVAEMAAAVLDKLAYQIAMQTFVGAWGGSQDASTPAWMKSARLGPLSGVARLWWGQGAWNAECAATVALACAESYMLPEIIAAVALDRQQVSWLRRQDVRGEVTARRVAYRTGDYLLASLQGDFADALPQQLWQVTLGADALIFGNAPACSSQHAAWVQNFWRGNAGPVRVAQWHDLLLVAYGRAAGTGLPFSHAYFPQANFDEVRFEQGWALARKGNGYAAITATGGIEAVRAGRDALREVRAKAEAVWLVQMGRAADDGTFAQFVERVLAQPLTLAQDAAHYMTLRGQQIDFSTGAPLEEAFVVEGTTQRFDDFPHVESIYGGAATLPAHSIDIRYLEHRMQLDFEMPSAA